jgi:hypothetical protein
MLCICSCPLFLAEQTIVAGIFLGLGIFGATVRASLEMQEKNSQQNETEQTAQLLTEAGKSIMDLINKASSVESWKDPGDTKAN